MNMFCFNLGSNDFIHNMEAWNDKNGPKHVISTCFLYSVMALLARVRLVRRLVSLFEFNHQFPSYTFLP